jgi:cytochrome c556
VTGVTTLVVIAKRLGAITLLAALAACGADGRSYDPDSPEGEAYVYRHSVMELIDAKARLLVGMVRQEIPLDEGLFAKAAADLAALSAMTGYGFENRTLVEGSRTSPAVWENWDDFQRRLSDFVQATAELADAVEKGGFGAAQGLVQPTMQNCGGCHRPYRLSIEEAR